MEFDSYARYLDFETRVLHRISTQMYLTEWFCLGSHFAENASLGLISKNTMIICLEPFSKNSFVPKYARQPLAKEGLGAEPPQDSIF